MMTTCGQARGSFVPSRLANAKSADQSMFFSNVTTGELNLEPLLNQRLDNRSEERQNARPGNRPILRLAPAVQLHLGGLRIHAACDEVEKLLASRLACLSLFFAIHAKFLCCE